MTCLSFHPVLKLTENVCVPNKSHEGPEKLGINSILPRVHNVLPRDLSVGIRRKITCKRYANMTLEQWFSAFLTLQPFKTVPRVAVTSQPSKYFITAS